MALTENIFEGLAHGESGEVAEATEAFSIQTRNGDANPAEIAVEWGVRQLGKKISVKTRSGVTKEITADYFPAYDEDGGLLVALIPKA